MVPDAALEVLKIAPGVPAVLGLSGLFQRATIGNVRM